MENLDIRSNKNNSNNKNKHKSNNSIGKRKDLHSPQHNIIPKNIGMIGLEEKSYIPKITLTIGKKYIIESLKYILNNYYNETTTEEIINNYSTLLDELLYSICNDSYLYNINFKNVFINRIMSYSNEALIQLSKPVNIPNIISYLIKYMQISIPNILVDVKNKVVQKFIRIEPNYKYEEDNILSDGNSTIKDIRFIINPVNFIKYSSLKDSNEISAFVYGLSLLNLIILDHLYNYIIETFNSIEIDGISSKTKTDFTFNDFITKSLSFIVPVIIGITNVSIYQPIAFKARDLIWEMYQLDSKDKETLNISKNEKECSITFKYKPKNAYFIHTLSRFHMPYDNENPTFKTNSKKEKEGSRNIIIKLFATKEGYLGIKSTLFSLNSVDDITNYIRQSFSPNSRQDFYPWVSDKDEYLYSNLNNLSKVLSYTKQHEELRQKAIKKARNKYNPSETYNIFLEETSKSKKKKDYIDNFVWNVMKKLSFQNISQYSIIDEELIKRFNLESYKEDYIIIANELASLDDSTVEEYISNVDKKQQNNIKKMIKYVRRTRKQTNVLHKLYTELLKEKII